MSFSVRTAVVLLHEGIEYVSEVGFDITILLIESETLTELTVALDANLVDSTHNHDFSAEIK